MRLAEPSATFTLHFCHLQISTRDLVASRWGSLPRSGPMQNECAPRGSWSFPIIILWLTADCHTLALPREYALKKKNRLLDFVSVCECYIDDRKALVSASIEALCRMRSSENLVVVRVIFVLFCKYEARSRCYAFVRPSPSAVLACKGQRQHSLFMGRLLTFQLYLFLRPLLTNSGQLGDDAATFDPSVIFHRRFFLVHELSSGSGP